MTQTEKQTFCQTLPSICYCANDLFTVILQNENKYSIIMKKASILFILFAFASYSIAQAQTDNTVEIAYNGTTATVTVADNISQHLTITRK